MAVLEIVALDEVTPQLIVPQAGDTYILPRATTTPAQFTSTLATGTAPLVIASTTKVTNLNADLLDDLSSAAFATAAQGTFAVSEIYTVDVATVANQDYVLWYDAPFAGTVTTVRTDCASGTCTLTGKVNTTALGGTANSVSSTATEQAHVATNTFVKGDKLQFTVSANSSCLTMAVAFYITRTS